MTTTAAHIETLTFIDDRSFPEIAADLNECAHAQARHMHLMTYLWESNDDFNSPEYQAAMSEFEALEEMWEFSSDARQTRD